jgi:hypothetical protein
METKLKSFQVTIDIVTVEQFMALYRISSSLSDKLKETLSWSRLTTLLDSWGYENKGYINDGYRPPQDITFTHYTDGYGNHVYWCKKTKIYYQEDSSD